MQSFFYAQICYVSRSAVAKYYSVLIFQIELLQNLVG